MALVAVLLALSASVAFGFSDIVSGAVGPPAHRRVRRTLVAGGRAARCDPEREFRPRSLTSAQNRGTVWGRRCNPWH
jgi:hypothetical protein